MHAFSGLGNCNVILIYLMVSYFFHCLCCFILACVSDSVKRFIKCRTVSTEKDEYHTQYLLLEDGLNKYSRILCHSENGQTGSCPWSAGAEQVQADLFPWVKTGRSLDMSPLCGPCVRARQVIHSVSVHLGAQTMPSPLCASPAQLGHYFLGFS